MSTINPIKVLEGLQYLLKVDLGSSYNVHIKNAVDVLEMFVDDANGHDNALQFGERLIVMGALREVLRARKLFPGNNLNLLALGEEYGELVKACMDEDHGAIYKEGVQTIAMVIRVLTEGDPSTDEFRSRKGLAPIVTQKAQPAVSHHTKSFDYADKDALQDELNDLTTIANVKDIRLESLDDKQQWKVSWTTIDGK